MKKKEFLRLLKSLGFVLIRSNKHEIWSNGTHTIPIPHGDGTQINRMLARRILKDIDYQGRVQELNYG